MWEREPLLSAAVKANRRRPAAVPLACPAAFPRCCYKSGDIQRLAVARDRLQRSRQALLQAYGPDLQRLRQLHGTRCPEHAM